MSDLAYVAICDDTTCGKCYKCKNAELEEELAKSQRYYYNVQHEAVGLADSLDELRNKNAELELEIEWRKGYEVDLLQRHNGLRKLAQAVVDARQRPNDSLNVSAKKANNRRIAFDALARHLEETK